MRPLSIAVFLALTSFAVGPAFAFHKRVDPIVAVTTSGDTALPRNAAYGTGLCWTTELLGIERVAAVPLKAYSLGVGGVSLLPPYGTDVVSPNCSKNGKQFLWESDEPGPGRQLAFYDEKKRLFAQPVVDPSGTASNATMDHFARQIFFESTHDFDGQNPTNDRQVFRSFFGAVTQLSRGEGTSRNPAVSAHGKIVAFESTSDPITGADTNTSQIWYGDLRNPASIAPITNGDGTSELPSVAGRGEVVVFQSTSALATDGHETFTPQVFLYHGPSGSYAQLTDELGGCTNPVVQDKPIFRVGYTCSGRGYYYDVRDDERHEVPAVLGSDTNRVIPELGTFFVVLSTNANLLGSGTTAGHQVYVWNIWKLAMPTVSNDVTWWPSRAID